ncbi:hypothetical protein Tco_0682910, partial [Tanacetum coccineum]
STKAPGSTDKQNRGTDKRNESTDKPAEGIDRAKVSTDRQVEVLITMSQNKQKEKEKGVEIRNIEDTERPRPTSTRSTLTLKPLPKIDPKAKGKGNIEEEDEFDTKSEDITEAEKKFKQLANDEEVARKARINADKILTEELQKEEREKFTIEQRAKFLHDTIAAQRKSLAQRRLKWQDQNFIAIGSAKDERQIKELNKDPEKKRLKKRVVNETPREEDTTKVPAEQEVTEQGTKKRKSGHVKMIARKRPRPQPDNDSDDEHIKCLRIITFEGTIDSEIMETKSFITRLHKVSSPDGNYLVVYRVNGHFRPFNYLMEVLHIFDRQDLLHLYDLVMKQYSEITPEDIELILWGDLKIMMESSTKENDQGLEVEEESTASLQLSWLVQDQTVPGKDKSNLLIADSLLKTIWLSMHHVMAMKHWLVQKQTDFGKDKSNLLIVDSLLKTIRLSIHLVVYNEELTIPEQTTTGKGTSNRNGWLVLPKLQAT